MVNSQNQKRKSINCVFDPILYSEDWLRELNFNNMKIRWHNTNYFWSNYRNSNNKIQLIRIPKVFKEVKNQHNRCKWEEAPQLWRLSELTYKEINLLGAKVQVRIQVWVLGEIKGPISIKNSFNGVKVSKKVHSENIIKNMLLPCVVKLLNLTKIKDKIKITQKMNLNLFPK